MSKQFGKLLTVFCGFALLSSQAHALDKVKIYLENKQSIINGSVNGIKFGNEKDDGYSVGKIISYINANRDRLVTGKNLDYLKSSKLYFKPEALDDKFFKAKIFNQGGSASVRLYQTFYYMKDGVKNYVTFEGAEINTFISNTESGGKVTSVNSSLINTQPYEHYIPKFKDINETVYANTSLENRILLVDALSHVEFSKIASSFYPNETFKSRDQFVKRAVLDEDLVRKFAKMNKSELKFVKDLKSHKYVLVHRFTAPFESDRIIDLNVEHIGSNLIINNRALTNHVKVNIYTGNILKLKKTLRRSGESEVWQNKKVKGSIFKQEDYDIALINLSKVSEYFKTKFSWNGYDNKGSDLDATVRYKGSKLFGTNALRQNAAWAPAPYNQFLFGAGGDTLGDFLEAFDVIGHEYFHAVISNTSNLTGGGETGALNEHISDIMGVGAESEIENKNYDFKIGEKVLKQSDQALRDFLTPTSSFSEQATHMRDVESTFGKYCLPNDRNDECGVHFSNGVLNKAVALAINDFGWAKMKSLIFEVATKRLRSNSDFKDYKNQMLIACADSKDFDSSMCEKIKSHFESVGIIDAADSGSAAIPGIDYDKELCEIIRSTCSIIEDKTGSVGEMCKKCENI